MTMRLMMLMLLVATLMVACDEPAVTDQASCNAPVCESADPDVEVIEAELVAMKLVPAKRSAVTGRLTYRQRIALPDNAIVKVQLQDVSLQDVAAKVIAEQIIETDGKQVPFDFVLPYDPAEIDERNTYSISVRITVDGKLRFINTTSHQVITRGKPTDLDVTVEKVGNPPAETLAEPAEEAPAEMATVTGTITLMIGGEPLPADAVIEVKLLRRRMGSPQKDVVAKELIDAGSIDGENGPYHFALPYATASIDEGSTYFVRAAVLGESMVSGDSVITIGSPTHLEIVVLPLGG